MVSNGCLSDGFQLVPITSKFNLCGPVHYTEGARKDGKYYPLVTVGEDDKAASAAGAKVGWSSVSRGIFVAAVVAASLMV